MFLQWIVNNHIKKLVNRGKTIVDIFNHKMGCNGVLSIILINLIQYFIFLVRIFFIDNANIITREDTQENHVHVNLNVLTYTQIDFGKKDHASFALSPFFITAFPNLHQK